MSGCFYRKHGDNCANTVAATAPTGRWADQSSESPLSIQRRCQSKNAVFSLDRLIDDVLSPSRTTGESRPCRILRSSALAA